MFKTLKFLFPLFLLLLVSLGLHLGVLYLSDLPLFADKILLSYAINFLLAAFIYFIIQQSMKKNSAQAGFIFITGSGLKFLFFFLIFYPHYQLDDVMQTTEFAAFFVPYALCLIFEVIYLSKQLNNQSNSLENSSEVPVDHETEKKK